MCQECDTIEDGKIYFEDFLRIVTEENRTVVQNLAVRDPAPHVNQSRSLAFR